MGDCGAIGRGVTAIFNVVVSRDLVLESLPVPPISGSVGRLLPVFGVTDQLSGIVVISVNGC